MAIPAAVPAHQTSEAMRGAEDGRSAPHRCQQAHARMHRVASATSCPPLCRSHGQHGQKCEAQDSSWSRTNTQLEAWLRPCPRITGGAAEQLTMGGGASEG